MDLINSVYGSAEKGRESLAAARRKEWNRLIARLVSRDLVRGEVGLCVLSSNNENETSVSRRLVDNSFRCRRSYVGVDIPSSVKKKQKNLKYFAYIILQYFFPDISDINSFVKLSRKLKQQENTSNFRTSCNKNPSSLSTLIMKYHSSRRVLQFLISFVHGSSL